MHWMAYATRSLALSASGLRVITSASGVRRASRSRPTTRVRTSRSVKIPTRRPCASVTSTPACRRASIVWTASCTVEVSERQIGSAGDRTAMVSFSSGPLASLSSSVFRRSSSIVAEYSSSNSPLMQPLPLDRNSWLGERQSRSRAGRDTRRLLVGVFVGVFQKLNEAADRRGQRLLTPVDQADGPHQVGDAHRHDGER